MKNILILFSLLFISVSTFSQKTIKASDLLKDIKTGKSVTISNATITGVLDLTYMNDALPKLPKRKKWWWSNGGSNAIEKQLTGSISFTNCVFVDDVLAYIPHEKSGYTFIANFEDDVTFKNCTFKRKAMFKYSNFEQNANFSNTKFNDDTTFKYAKFERNSSFKNVVFEHLATFKYAEFRRLTDFSNAVFQNKAIFKYANFKDGVSFNNTNFEEDLNIKYTKVRGEFDITNMKVAYDIDSKYTTINGKSFSKYALKSK